MGDPTGMGNNNMMGNNMMGNNMMGNNMGGNMMGNMDGMGMGVMGAGGGQGCCVLVSNLDEEVRSVCVRCSVILWLWLLDLHGKYFVVIFLGV